MKQIGPINWLTHRRKVVYLHFNDNHFFFNLFFISDWRKKSPFGEYVSGAITFRHRRSPLCLCRVPKGGSRRDEKNEAVDALWSIIHIKYAAEEEEKGGERTRPRLCVDTFHLRSIEAGRKVQLDGREERREGPKRDKHLSSSTVSLPTSSLSLSLSL